MLKHVSVFNQEYLKKLVILKSYSSNKLFLLRPKKYVWGYKIKVGR